MGECRFKSVEMPMTTPYVLCDPVPVPEDVNTSLEGSRIRQFLDKRFGDKKKPREELGFTSDEVMKIKRFYVPNTRTKWR